MRKRLDKGLIQVYTGNNKGKTTAALGLAFRAMGHGLKVGMVQFMKGSCYYGELFAAERFKPNFDIFQYGRNCFKSPILRQGEDVCEDCKQCFVIKGQATDYDYKTAELAWERAKELVLSGEYDIVILDEIMNAFYFELLETAPVIELLKQKPEHVEVVMTGRNAPKEIIEIADLVTEMVQIKHPYNKGITARWGVEY